MSRKLLAPFVIAGFAIGAQLVVGNVAQAHHPLLAAEIVCESDTPTINYTSTAWEGLGPDPTNDPSRANTQIDISVNGTVVASGAYVAPNYSFSGSIPLPAGVSAGDNLQMTAVAVGTWGGGFTGGVAEIWIVVPDLSSCIDIEANGRFTGGGSQVRVGSARVTRGLTIHCDLLLSNNLEVNWGGNRFHMLEHLTTVACTDDPAIIQAPPPAPLDTLIGTGVGRYNGNEGYSIEFTLVDYGEPGSSDQMRIYIYETATPSNVVLNVPLQTLTGGNLQAHYDQPHK